VVRRAPTVALDARLPSEIVALAVAAAPTHRLQAWARARVRAKRLQMLRAEEPMGIRVPGRASEPAVASTVGGKFSILDTVDKTKQMQRFGRFVL
jgi:hypothetical protein